MAGRPLKFQSINDLQCKIQDYFDSCYEEVWVKDVEGVWNPQVDRNGTVLKKMVKPPTITGLAIALDTTRRTLLDYEDKEDEFSHTIKKAKLMCENFAEEQLFTSRNIAGVIFNLKNNYSWVDKQEKDYNFNPANLTDDEIKEQIKKLTSNE